MQTVDDISTTAKPPGALTREEAAYLHLASFARGQRVVVTGRGYALEGTVTAPQRDGASLRRSYLTVTGTGTVPDGRDGWAQRPVEAVITVAMMLGARCLTVATEADAAAGNWRYFDKAGYAAWCPDCIRLSCDYGSYCHGSATRNPGGCRVTAVSAARAPSPDAGGSRAFAGLPESVSAARSWVAGFFPDPAAAADAALMTSELFTNAVLYSASGLPGGQVTVSVRTADGAIRVEVVDQGAVPPCMATPPGLGQGLALVAALADASGADGCDCWFALRAGGAR